MPSLMRGEPDLVLASASPTRARMLRDAGLVFRTVPAHVDEPALRARLRRQRATTAAAACALARAKAEQVSSAEPAALVLGADQLLEHEGRWPGKPETPRALRAQLAALSNAPHTLTSAVVACRNGTVLWQAADTARLVMRPLGRDFLDRYLAGGADDLLGSAGGYRLEGTGSHLFSSVEGDWFTIMGLPLLPLLAWLRRQRVIGE